MAPDNEHDAEPIIPPRPARKSSIKSIPETPEMAPDYEHHAEPVIPPRPVRPASIKSIPETANDGQDVEPVVPPRPTRKTSSRSIPETTELVPIIPQRPTRRSSVQSVKSQYSIEEPELEKVPSTTGSLGNGPEISEVPETSQTCLENDQYVQPEELAPPIEEIPTSPHQHPVTIEAPDKLKEESVPEIPSRPSKKPVEEPIPNIPPRPNKHDEPGFRTAEIAALASQQPIIPPRPQKPKPHPADPVPKVAMDQTPDLISTGGGVFESVEEPISSKQRRIDPETILDVKPPHPSLQQSPPSVPKEAAAPASEVQTEAAAKLTKAKAPPIPARPQHKLARQFEQQTVKEKPAPPPRPTKPVLAGASKFAGLRAQFAKDLNERLAKPPAPPPTKKEEEVHSMEVEPVAVAAVATATLGSGVAAVVAVKESGKVEDVRKGRARGPTRRPPTVKPIVPAGWGVSEIATIFEQKGLSQVGETDNSERESQTGERLIESDNAVKMVYLDGKVEDEGSGIGHAVVPMETSAMEEPEMEKAEVVEPMDEGIRNSEEPAEIKAIEPEPEGVAPTDDVVEKIKGMEEGHSGFHVEDAEEPGEPEPPVTEEEY